MNLVFTTKLSIKINECVQNSFLLILDLIKVVEELYLCSFQFLPELHTNKSTRSFLNLSCTSYIPLSFCIPYIYLLPSPLLIFMNPRVHYPLPPSTQLVGRIYNISWTFPRTLLIFLPPTLLIITLPPLLLLFSWLAVFDSILNTHPFHFS